MKAKNQWLFPEIEAEVKEDRQAAARESAQRLREERRRLVKMLRNSEYAWVIDHLVDHGPLTEMGIISATDSSQKALEGLLTLYALWRIGKLWRVSQGHDPHANEESFLYGIKKVHTKPISSNRI